LKVNFLCVLRVLHAQFKGFVNDQVVQVLEVNVARVRVL